MISSGEIVVKSFIKIAVRVQLLESIFEWINLMINHIVFAKNDDVAAVFYQFGLQWFLLKDVYWQYKIHFSYIAVQGISIQGFLHFYLNSQTFLLKLNSIYHLHLILIDGY